MGAANKGTGSTRVLRCVEGVTNYLLHSWVGAGKDMAHFNDTVLMEVGIRS